LFQQKYNSVLYKTMVKQIGVSEVSAIKGQSYTVQPPMIGFPDVSSFHETKASIMARLGDGKSTKLSKLETMKKHGLTGGSLVGGTLVGGAMAHPSHQQNRALEDIEALRKKRLVVPFTGGLKSPFLNFTTGRSTRGAHKTRMTSVKQGDNIIKTDTKYGRL
jgi:hypothetical protein